MGWSPKAASPSPGRTWGRAHLNWGSPCTSRSQAQFSSLKLIETYRFVLLFTERLWVVCLRLSRSACCKEQAAGVPEAPASPMQVSLWPLVAFPPPPGTHAGALLTPSSPANTPPSPGAPRCLLPSHLHRSSHTSRHDTLLSASPLQSLL